MSDFADELNSWVARQAQASVEEQVIAMYAEENPAPEGQEWFIVSQERDGDEVAYRFELRAATE